jgi:hypothetical protein
MRIEFGEYMTSTEDGGWRRKTNGEITELYKDSNIVQHIKAQRIRCPGHVGKMPDQIYVNKTLLEVERGKKKRVIPKKKWLEAVTTDLRNVGVTDWKTASQGREKWRKLIKNSCNDMENGM